MANYLIQDKTLKDLRRSMRSLCEFFDSSIKEVETYSVASKSSDFTDIDYAQEFSIPERYYDFRFRSKRVQLWNYKKLHNNVVSELKSYLYAVYCYGFIPSNFEHTFPDYFKFSETDSRFCLYGSFRDFHTAVSRWCDVVNELTAVQSKGLF